MCGGILSNRKASVSTMVSTISALPLEVHSNEGVIFMEPELGSHEEVLKQLESSLQT